MRLFSILEYVLPSKKVPSRMIENAVQHDFDRMRVRFIDELTHLFVRAK